MKNRKLIKVIGIACLAFNALSLYFFITRKDNGNYIKLVSYAQLYSKENNDPAGLKKWQQTIHQYDPEEIKKGQELTRVNADIRETDSTFTKILKIASWLKRSYSQLAITKPTRAFARLPITAQYLSALNAESPVWCGTFASHFLFFCSINGITSRYIGIIGKDSHVLNEFYIPESGEWVLTDLTFNAVYCTNEEGKKLNAVDILYLNSRQDSSLINIYGQDSSGKFSLIPRKATGKVWKLYLKTDGWLNFYYRTNLEEVYTPFQKLRRYAYPTVWFETFTLTPVSNTIFYFRILSLYTGIALAIIFFTLIYLKRK